MTLIWYPLSTTIVLPFIQILRYGWRAGTLQWRHNESDGVSNHRRHDCLFNCLFRRRSKKASKPSVTGLCKGNSPVIGVNPPYKGPVTREMFLYDNAIMVCTKEQKPHSSTSLAPLWEVMMTSSNGNIFRVTGHLCGEFTGHRWTPRTKASDAELWCFLWSSPE